MNKPKLIHLSSEDQDGLIQRIQSDNLTSNDKEILTGLIEFNNWLQFSVQEKSISISRLQNIYGNSSEKSNRKKNNKNLNQTILRLGTHLKLKTVLFPMNQVMNNHQKLTQLKILAEAPTLEG